MSKIYTKTGDDGSTQLLSGKRVAKYHIRVEAYGSIDELSSHIGFLRSLEIEDNLEKDLIDIQRILFNISSLLACDGGKFLDMLEKVKQEDIDFLEKKIDEMTEIVGPLTKFILPGGQKEVAYIHICRTVSRRAERNIVKLSHTEQVDKSIIVYINRLSDYLFTLSRYVSKQKQFEQNFAKT